MTLRCRLIQSSKLASRLVTKVQAGTAQVAYRCMTNIVYRKMVALEPVIIGNAGTATMVDVGKSVQPFVSIYYIVSENVGLSHTFTRSDSRKKIGPAPLV
jgi:hypothetical protein